MINKNSWCQVPVRLALISHNFITPASLFALQITSEFTVLGSFLCERNVFHPILNLFGFAFIPFFFLKIFKSM